MNTALAIAAIASALIALATLIYAIRSGRKQINKIAEQTELLRKQIFGEIYETAQIRDLRFYLPEKRKHPVQGFEHLQEEKKEVNLGKEVEIRENNKTELHVQFWMDAPQRLRAIRWGFIDNPSNDETKEYPTIPRLRRAFVVEKTSEFEREIYKDWHGHWHMEFPFSRFTPKDEVFVLCFAVQSKSNGRFPLEVSIRTEEAKKTYTETIWVKVVS